MAPSSAPTIHRTGELDSALRPIRKHLVHRAVEPVPQESHASKASVACGTAKLARLFQPTYGGSMLDWEMPDGNKGSYERNGKGEKNHLARRTILW
jgi:hypothetical protein